MESITMGLYRAYIGLLSELAAAVQASWVPAANGNFHTWGNRSIDPNTL